VTKAKEAIVMMAVTARVFSIAKPRFLARIAFS
jgi:hypothetical protein